MNAATFSSRVLLDAKCDCGREFPAKVTVHLAHAHLPDVPRDSLVTVLMQCKCGVTWPCQLRVGS